MFLSFVKHFLGTPFFYQHMETVHEISISYDCDVCHESGFKSKLALRVHLLNLHRLHCCICRKKLPSNEALLAHRKKHNDEPFDCRECGKSFSSESVIVQHFFIQHPLTAFSCRDCVHVFASFVTDNRNGVFHANNYACLFSMRKKFLAAFARFTLIEYRMPPFRKCSAIFVFITIRLVAIFYPSL